MAFTHGKDTKVIVGEVDLSGFFNSTDVSRDVDVPETTVYGNDDRTFIAGIRNGTLSLSGFFDGAANAVDEEISSALGGTSTKLITVGLNGLTVGNVVYLVNAHYTSYSVSAPVDGVVSVSVDAQSTAGLDNGRSLHNLTAETATANGASVDNSVATANGGVAFLHVTAIGAATSPTLDVIVQHSTDNAAFTTLAAFTQVTTTLSSERVLVAAGTTVNRYLRASWTIGGTGGPSYTFTVGFARR